MPYAQNSHPGIPVTIVARGRDGRPPAIADVAAAVQRIDPLQPVARVSSLEDFLGASLASPRFRTAILMALGTLALVIVAVGTYGVTARTVGERTREIGVRLALGATPLHVWRSVALQSLRAVGVGAIGGAVTAVLTTPLLTRVVPDIRTGAAREIMAAAVLLLGLAALAAFAASARAARLHPVEAMRADEA